MDHPPLESTSPLDWRYTAEGGANLVVSFVGQRGAFTGKLLRLRKKKKLPFALEAIPTEMDVEFGRQIIRPLLGEEHVVQMERLSVSAGWLAELKQALIASEARPAHREAEDEVDEQSGVVVLAEDLVHGDGVLAIEIKPKWGFLPSPNYLSPSSRAVKTSYCRFCMHSYMKKADLDPVAALSEHDEGYCPLDLYSGDAARVTRAVEALWEAWTRTDGTANNLRFFYEGHRVEPSDTTNLESFLSNSSAEQGHSATTVDSATTKSGLTSILVPILLAAPLLSTLASLQASLDPLDIEGISSLIGLQLDSPSASASPLLSPQPTLDEWNSWLSSQPPSASEPCPRHLLLSFLLSATFKDCSIFIRLMPNGASVVKAIDLDPKPLDRLPKYYKLDQRVVITWREMLEAREEGAKGIRKCFV